MNRYWRCQLLFAAAERRKYNETLRQLPRLIESNRYNEIEKLLVSCGSFQVATNFRDLVNFFCNNRDQVSKIIEIGTFNFASSTLINCLKNERALFFGFDNWDIGGAKTRATAEWRAGFFPNARVITGHPMSSELSVGELQDANMLVVDGHHSFRAT